MNREACKKALEKPEGNLELIEDIQTLTESSLSDLWLGKREDVWDRYLNRRKR